jgi:hypothetical protein
MAREIWEALHGQHAYLTTLPPETPTRRIQEDRMDQLFSQYLRVHYLDKRFSLLAGDTCGRRGCHARIDRFGQEYCSTRCRVAAHRALKRALRAG